MALTPKSPKECQSFSQHALAERPNHPILFSGCLNVMVCILNLEKWLVLNSAQVSILPNHLIHDSVATSDKEQICNVINEYFISLGNLVKKIYLPCNTVKNETHTPVRIGLPGLIFHRGYSLHMR